MNEAKDCKSLSAEREVEEQEAVVNDNCVRNRDKEHFHIRYKQLNDHSLSLSRCVCCWFVTTSLPTDRGMAEVHRVQEAGKFHKAWIHKS